MNNRIILISLITSLLSWQLPAQQIEWALYDTPKTIVASKFNDGLAFLFEHGKYGLINYKGTVLIEPSCDYIEICDYGLARVKKEAGQSGVMNSEGAWVLDPIYADISIYGSLIVARNSEKKDALYSGRGEQILPFEYSITSVNDFSLLEIKSDEYNFLYCYQTDSLYDLNRGSVLGDYYNLNDSILIDKNCKKHTFEEMFTSSGGAKVIKQEGKLKLKKPDGTLTDLNILASTYKFGNLYNYQNDTLFRYDAKGNCTIIPCKGGFMSYDYGVFAYWNKDDFSDGVFLNKDGKVIVNNLNSTSAKFQTPYIIGLTVLNEDGLWVYNVYDTHAGRLIKSYKEVSEKFENGLCRVKDQQDRYGYIDEHGREVIRTQYSSAEEFSEGLAYVESEKFINPQGQVVLSSNSFLRYSGGFHGQVAPVYNFYHEKHGFVYNPFIPAEDRLEYNGLTPDLAEVYKYQGNIELNKKDYAMASNYYISSIQCDSTDADVWNNLGVCFDKTGNAEYASVCFEESVRLDGNETAQNNLALVNGRQSSDSAEESSDGGWLGILSNLGNSLMDLGNSLSGQSNNNVADYGQYQSAYTGDISDYDTSDNSTKRDITFYQRSYDGWARRAEMCYKALTTTGYRTEDNNGKVKGGSTNHTYYVQQKKLLREAQNKMRDVRMKAARDGYTIAKNKYEDAEVSIY